VIRVQERNAGNGLPAAGLGGSGLPERAFGLRCRSAVLMVLIVSDNRDFRAAAARVLEREGCEVVTAAHAGHALLAWLEAPVDVLIADARMEDGSAGAIAAMLRRRRAGVPVVYLGLVPFTADDLIRAVRTARAARSAFRPPSSSDR
jgi:DNA-binding NtrC family response regulator